MKPIYSMSTTGECSRALAAARLGYEPTPMTKTDEARLQHYSRCEALAAQQIMDMGFRVQAGDYCSKCQRYGIHVEVDTALFLLVGHLDRRLALNGRWLPVEIKSLGKASWMKFSKSQFGAFSNYAGQEVCYLEAEKQPGIYWVMERDSGEPLRYIVNDTENMIDLDGFERVTLPVTFDQIMDKLNLIEVVVQDGSLTEGEEGDSCYFCRYKFLCVKPEEKTLKVETLPSLVEAAEMYRQGKEQEKSAKEMVETARDTFLLHAKNNRIDKYKVSGVSVSYRGQKTKVWLDERIIRAEASPELIRLATRESEPYDDYSIRLLKEG